jgi:hypothetical protein
MTSLSDIINNSKLIEKTTNKENIKVVSDPLKVTTRTATTTTTKGRIDLDKNVKLCDHEFSFPSLSKHSSSTIKFDNKNDVNSVRMYIHAIFQEYLGGVWRRVALKDFDLKRIS